MSDLIPIEEIAARLRISRQRVRRMIDERRMPGVRWGRTYRVGRVAWERWLESWGQ